MSFLEYFAWVMNTVIFLKDMVWLILSPSVAPWVGALAALASAITIDSKRWICSLGGFMVRSIRIIVIWLLMIHILRHIPGGKGKGEGGVDDKGNGGNGQVGSSNGKHENSSVGQAPKIIDGKQVDLVIGFPADDVNHNRGKEFTFEIKIGQNDIKTLIAKNNEDLFTNLARVLQESNKRFYLVYIKLKLNPGDSVLKQIEDTLNKIHPGISIVQGD